MKTDQYRVRPGSKVHLAHWNPSGTDGFDGKKTDGVAELESLNEHMADLQALLYAEHKHKVLVVLQGMDTSGKDGTIKHVFRIINPLGVKVANFKRPNDTELDHDFLWRIHEHTPATGRITIFNRSHYEDVLVVRVHDLAPRETLAKRYDHINDFERMLADEGTVIRKFFLHISDDEQRSRLQARLDDPTKHWKFEGADLEERKLWSAYEEAYETVLSKTSTEWAPWYVVPANKKWYRNLVVSQVLIETLEGLRMDYPPAPPGLDDITIA